MEDSLQKAIYMVSDLFFLLFLVAVGVHFSNQTPLNAITKSYLEAACVNGGFTQADIDSMLDDLNNNGFNRDKIEITLSTQYPARVMNITDTDYVKRGNIICIKVQNNDLGLLDTLFKKLGVTNDTKNICILYGMSERY